MAESTAFTAAYDQLILNPELRQLFGGEGTFNAGWWGAGARDLPAAGLQLVDRLLELLPAGERPRRVLEVACGLGATSRQLRRRLDEAELVATNLSLQQLAWRRDGWLGARRAAADAVALPFAPASFDAVVCVEAALHFPSREKFLLEARRLLRPGGTLLASDILLVSAGTIGEWLAPAGSLGWSPERYHAALAEAGFGEVRLLDATAESWLPFCAAMESWGEELHRRGELDADGVAALRHRVAGLRRDVSHYLLLAASRA